MLHVDTTEEILEYRIFFKCIEWYIVQHFDRSTPAAAAAAEANGEVLPEARKRVSVYRDYKATGVSFFLFFHGKLKS
jgi:hypothetical protein